MQGQLVVVLTQDLSDVCGTLFALEGEELLFSHPVTVGKRGMALNKREGDQCSPLGLFAITELFGNRPPHPCHMPFLQMGAEDIVVDDPKSKFYNAFAKKGSSEKDWESFEEMARSDGLYEMGAVIDYNRQAPKPYLGSAIFLHIWRGPKMGTAGCTAMARQDMLRLARWLDAQRRPHLLQLPITCYERFLSSLANETIKTAVTKRVGRLIKE